MPTTVTVSISGLRELGEKMRALDQKVRQKIIRTATSAGSNIIRDAAREKAPVLTGALKKAIVARRSRRQSSTVKGYEEHHVGVFKVKGGKYGNTANNRRLGRVGKVFRVDPPTFYWKFLELGTVKDREGHPFLRPAFDSHKSQAADAIIAKLRTEIAKAVK